MITFLIVAGVALLFAVLLLMYRDGYCTPQAAHTRATMRLIRQADKIRERVIREQVRHYESSINPRKGRK
jgi:hypothetical protein